MIGELRKKVFIETWGCQMNVADSEAMLASLKQQNFEPTDRDDEAELIILNTCHIREKAKHKVLSRLGVLRDLKIKRPETKIAVAGCVAQAEGKKLLNTAPYIDIILGPGRIADLPNLLQAKQKGPQIALGFESNKAADTEGQPLIKREPLADGNPISRFVTIAQGCDNFCTFCVVPFTRGREVSVPATDIETECKRLLAEGAKEITLLGQNVNSYGKGTFVELLERILACAGLERLRFTTSNPHDFTKRLADLFVQHPNKMGAYMHLPVQSGNDEVLRRMQRKVTVEEYLEKIFWLRAARPDFAISTDIIVGFPGETEQQFADTMALVEKVRFSFIYAFKYSPRKNTAAYRFRDQVDEDKKNRRLSELLQLQQRITMEQQQAEFGQKRSVLFAYPSKKDPNSYYGRTEHFRLVRTVNSVSLAGQVRQVKIVDGNTTALVGELL